MFDSMADKIKHEARVEARKLTYDELVEKYAETKSELYIKTVYADVIGNMAESAGVFK